MPANKDWFARAEGGSNCSDRVGYSKERYRSRVESMASCRQCFCNYSECQEGKTEVLHVLFLYSYNIPYGKWTVKEDVNEWMAQLCDKNIEMFWSLKKLVIKAIRYG